MARHLWETPARTLAWENRPLVMGILNVTPDSFSDGGRYADLDEALARAHWIQSRGADILDIGAESTRPGARPVSVEEELRRLGEVLRHLAGQLRIPVSIDTTKAEVARFALDHGAEIVNDVSAGQWDAGLWPLVAERKAGYVLMHCQGRPENMQAEPRYGDVAGEVAGFLRERLGQAEAAGMAARRIVLDPGFGFGKTARHNAEMLERFEVFCGLGRPVAAGISRKAFVRRTVGEKQVLVGTVAAQVVAAMRGAAIWRVHDVEEAVAAARMMAPAAEDEHGA